MSARELLAVATSRPWRLQGWDDDEQAAFILGGGPAFSAPEHLVAAGLNTPGNQEQATRDAELIVVAVNEHEALLAIEEVLKLARQFLGIAAANSMGARADRALAQLAAVRSAAGA